jgi:hypothetical protein
VGQLLLCIASLVHPLRKDFWLQHKAMWIVMSRSTWPGGGNVALQDLGPGIGAYRIGTNGCRPALHLASSWNPLPPILMLVVIRARGTPFLAHTKCGNDARPATLACRPRPIPSKILSPTTVNTTRNLAMPCVVPPCNIECRISDRITKFGHPIGYRNSPLYELVRLLINENGKFRRFRMGRDA